MVVLYGILILECAPPVSAFPAISHLVQDVLGNEGWPIQLSTCGIKGVLIDDVHILLSIEQLRTLVGI